MASSCPMPLAESWRGVAKKSMLVADSPPRLLKFSSLARCAGPPVTAVDALLRDPTVVLRLVPLAILSLAFPGLMIPVLFPKPRKPEVEMSDDEGEQGKGETKGEDDETVGCIPGG